MLTADKARVLAHEAAKPDDLPSDHPVWKAIIRWGEAQYSAGPYNELQAACAAVDQAVRDYAAAKGGVL